MRDAEGISDSEWSGLYFAIELRLYCPAIAPLSLTATIKPLFDGVISSFHSYPDPPVGLADRIAPVVQGSPDAVRDAMTNPWSSALGRRRLVWPRGSGVQWNPADDKCVAGEILRIDSPQWRLAGILSEVTPVDASMNLQR
jgi:hypothetical protein